MVLYGIKNCNSVKKAVKFLGSHQIHYEFVDFRNTPMQHKTIEEWITFGATVEKLFNSRSTTYRNLKLKDLQLDDLQKIEWMSKENLLIKRPVLVANERIIIGFNESQYRDLFNSKER